MFEIRIAFFRARRQQHNARIVAMTWCQAAQRLVKGIKERLQMPNLAVTKDIRQGARQDEAVFYRITSPCRTLRAVGHHPPLSIGSPDKIHGMQVEITVIGHAYAMTRP